MPTVAALIWGNYGRIISKPAVALVVSISVLAVNIGLIIGGRIWDVPLATDISKLWIDPASQVAANNALVTKFGDPIEVSNNELITLTNSDFSNLLNVESMTRWEAYMDAALDTVIYDEITNSTYTILDVCNGRSGQVSYAFGCSMYNPIDYFTEGVKYFPTAAATQWILDFKLAYPYILAGAGSTATGKAYLWNWAITADLASAGDTNPLTAGTTVVYTTWFTKKCMESKVLLCGDKTDLVNKVDTLMANALFPGIGKMQFGWIKAYLVLGGILGGAGQASPYGTCNVTGNPVNLQTTTTTDNINLLNPFTVGALQTKGYVNSRNYSIANCATTAWANAATPGGPCTNPVSTCNFLMFATLGTLDFTSPCASCVMATMWWMGELDLVQTGVKPLSNWPLTGVVPSLAIWDTSNYALSRLVSKGIAVAAANATAQTISCAENVALPPSNCTFLFNKFYDATIAGLSGDIATALGTVQPRADALGLLALDPLTELGTYFGGKAGLDKVWANLLLNTNAIPAVAPALKRHATRKSYKGKTSAQIGEILSGFKNDLATQNLRPAIFGGAIPHPSKIQAGSCKCASGYAGSDCSQKLDYICDCDSTLKPTCIGGLLQSCQQMASCAGYTAITGLVDGAAGLGIDPSSLAAFANFRNDILVGTAFAVPSATPTAVTLLQTHCASFLPCADGYNVTLDPTLASFAPDSFKGIAASTSWNAALLGDLSPLSTNKYINRGSLLAMTCLLSQQVSSGSCHPLVNIISSTISGPSFTLAEVGALATCSQGKSLLLCAATNVTTSPKSWTDAGLVSGMTATTGCPQTYAYYNGLVTQPTFLTFDILFSCFAEMTQRLTQVPGPAYLPLSPRCSDAVSTCPGGTQGFSPVGSSVGKTAACAGATRYNGAGVAQLQCTRAWITFVWQGVEKTLDGIAAAAPTHVGDALTAFGATTTTDRSTARQRNDISQYFAGQLSTNPMFVANVTSNIFSNCATYGTCPVYTAMVNNVLDGSCNASSVAPLFVPVAMTAKSCRVLLDNIVGAVSKNPAALAPVARELAQYRFMGTVFGTCGANGVLAGTGECWGDDDCSFPKGTCNNLTYKQPMTNVTTFAAILLTNDPEGTVSFMRRPESIYRALANKPIIDRYLARLSNSTGRRLDTIQLGNPNANASLTVDDADRIIKAWRKAMIGNIKAFRDSSSASRADVYTADSASDLLNDISKADVRILVLGYGLMLLYSVLSCTNWSTDVQAMMNGSRAFVAQSGIILVAISVASGLGVSHLAGVQWSAAATQIVPFVMLGLGVSDTFVLMRIWPYYQDGVSASDAAAKALTIAGPPMLLVSATNAGVFAVGVLTAMPVVVNFALQAVIVVVANYITTNLMLPALLVLDYNRMAAGRADLLPCVKVGTSARAQVAAQDTGYEQNVFNRWCTPFYASCLLSIPGKLFVIAWSAAFLGSAVYGVASYAELGLQLSDVAPAGSDLANALITRDTEFGFYTVSVATSNADWSLREVQQGIVDIYNKVMATPYIVPGSGLPWMQVMMSWGQVDTPLYDTNADGQICSPTSSRTGGKCGKAVGCQVITADDSVVNGSIPFFARADFKRCLTLWVRTDLGYEAIKPQFPLVDPYATRTARAIKFSDSDDPLAAFLPYTTGTLFAQNLRQNADFVQLINQVRAVANNQTTPPSFPLGEPIDFWDQYVSLSAIINKAVGYGLLICFCTIWFLLLLLVEGDSSVPKRIFATFWAASLTTGIIALSVYEIYGYMAFAGLKISAIPAISIIMSTGVAVEYTAYVAVAFVNGAGTLNERSRHALMLMMAPVVDGGITMFLGVVMLAASPFVFIVKYFFYPWLLIIFFGFFNGIAFLPVLFSLVGPPAVKSSNKTEALSTKQ